MKIKLKYPKGLYNFIWIKGIIELIMSFFLLYGLAFGQYGNKVLMFLFTLFLMFFGINDLQYFLKLKDAKKTEE